MIRDSLSHMHIFQHVGHNGGGRLPHCFAHSYHHNRRLLYGEADTFTCLQIETGSAGDTHLASEPESTYSYR